MAYVGTPSYSGSARETLARIIQGEAGGEGLRGMQAVGGVIQNRANSNFSGYGTGLLDQALARNQFQGQSSNPSANAYSVADSLLNGTLQDPTGGATSYANPSGSTARWALNLNPSNSLQIGNHFFTDNQRGVPFQPNVNPNNGGVYGSGTNTPRSLFATDASPATQPDGTPMMGFGDGKTMTLPNAAGGPAGNGAFGLTSTPGTGGAVPQGTAGSVTPFGGMSATVPQAIDKQTQQDAKDAEAARKQSEKNTKSATDTAQGIYKDAKAATDSWLVRIAFVLVGIVFLAGALFMFGRPTQIVKTVKAAL